MKKIILASASPRRREILESMHLKFEVMVSGTDESKIENSLDTGIYVQELALLKAGAVCRQIHSKDALIIAADTVVSVDGKILGKPRDKEDAFNMLSSLSGRCHSVFTGLCVMRAKDAFSVCKSVETKVYFKKLTDEKIKAYVNTGEPMDKAGAYGIQGLGALLTEKIDGDYFNVVGLPASKLAEILEDEFDFDVLKENCNEI